MAKVLLYADTETGEILDVQGKPSGCVVVLKSLLSDPLIEELANDGCRNVIGGIYATSVIDFARAVEQATRTGIMPKDIAALAVNAPERIGYVAADATHLRAYANGWNEAIDALGIKP